MNGAADRVAGDEREHVPDTAPYIRVHGTYGGGDPTLHRIREVDVEVPIANCYPVDYTMIVRAVLAELRRIADLASYETAIHAGGETFPVPGATSAATAGGER
jgi:hypothetical protein